MNWTEYTDKQREVWLLIKRYGWDIEHCDYMTSVLWYRVDYSQEADFLVHQLVRMFRPLRDDHYGDSGQPNLYTIWFATRLPEAEAWARVNMARMVRDRVELNSALLQITNQTRRYVEMATKQGRCAECGATTEQVTLINGVVYCADCRNIDHTLCEVCDTWAEDTDMDEMNGEAMCDACYAERAPCGNCGGTVLVDSAQDVDGDYMCDDCIDEHYFKCDNCGDYAYNDEGTSVGFDSHICQDCFDDNYTSCDDCGDSIHRDHTYSTFDDVVIQGEER